MEVESASSVLSVVPRLIRIAFETPVAAVNHYLWFINFLTPNHDYRWQFENTVITAVPLGSHAHFVIVLGKENGECADVPRKRKIYFQMEPDQPLPGPEEGYLFVVSLELQSRVLVPFDFTPYKVAKQLDYPVKQHDLLVICKKGGRTERQKKRLELLQKLASDPTLDIHIYSFDMTEQDLPGCLPGRFKGRWENPNGVDINKADLMRKYRYCLAIDKHDCKNYITNQFSDALLGYALPLYSGAPNVDDYYDEKSFHLLKNFPTDLDATVEEIRNRVRQPVTVYEIAAMSDSRHRIYNYFSLWALLKNRIPEIYEATKSMFEKK